MLGASWGCSSTGLLLSGMCLDYENVVCSAQQTEGFQESVLDIARPTSRHL